MKADPKFYIAIYELNKNQRHMIEKYCSIAFVTFKGHKGSVHRLKTDTHKIKRNKLKTACLRNIASDHTQKLSFQLGSMIIHKHNRYIAGQQFWN